MDHMANHIFVSYAREDDSFVRRLAGDLRDRGLPVWLDQWNIERGQNWDRAIATGIEGCGVFLIVLSPAAVASDAVLNELDMALEEEKRVIPVRLEPCELPLRIRRRQYLDFSERVYADALGDLLSDLGASPEMVTVPAVQAPLPHEEAQPRQSYLFYVLALLAGAVVSAGAYILFRLTLVTTGNLFLWISILSPWVVGLWMGWVYPPRGAIQYLALGAGAGLINSVAVSLALEIYHIYYSGRTSIQDVVNLYFLTPFVLTVFGAIVGVWLRRRGGYEAEPPAYARSLARAMAGTKAQDRGEAEVQMERFTKLTTGLVPILIFIASIVAAILTYLAATSQSGP
jgi:hypothetical protein